MDQRYVLDDSYITALLETHNVSADIIANIISIISTIRDNIRYQFLNIDYLTYACYSLICNNMDINLDHITYVDKYMIKSRDHDNSCKVLIRYAKYILSSHKYPYST